MGKWYGKIGFAQTVESVPGVWIDEIVTRTYYGDLVRNTSKYQTAGQLNDDLAIANQISIVADPFAYQNFHSIKYVEFMGANWKVTNVEVQYPRLILTIGGVFNGTGGPKSDPAATVEAP